MKGKHQVKAEDICDPSFSGPDIWCDDGRSGELRHAELVALLGHLADIHYHFIATTPATHGRVLRRKTMRQARDLADILGWGVPFTQREIAAETFRLLAAADALDKVEAPGSDSMFYRSRIRVSALQGQLFIHSAFPTVAQDAVFLGPDSYRFTDLILAELSRAAMPPESRIIDIGTGAGVGAIVAAQAMPQARVIATDINPRALAFTRINAEAAGAVVHTREADGLKWLDDAADLILANPPYIMDPAERSYRDGGGMHGGALTILLARDALARLAPGGRLILYSGSAIVRGADPVRRALTGLVDGRDYSLTYREIDPDVFGEELDQAAYADVDRIAVIAAIVTRHLQG